MVRVKRVASPGSRLLDPSAPEWRGVPSETLTLQPTPWASQPSPYVQASWRDRPYGVTGGLAVQAAHNGEAIFFRLVWGDETRDDGISNTDQFSDAAAVLFPLMGDAPLGSMGSPDQPVQAWYWRPDLEEPLRVTARGLGTTARRASVGLSARASYGDGGWAVVISRRLVVMDGETISFAPGQTGNAAFAVWQGANQERAGLKAVTMEWQPLEIER